MVEVEFTVVVAEVVGQLGKMIRGIRHAIFFMCGDVCEDHKDLEKKRNRLRNGFTSSYCNERRQPADLRSASCISHTRREGSAPTNSQQSSYPSSRTSRTMQSEFQGKKWISMMAHPSTAATTSSSPTAMAATHWSSAASTRLDIKVLACEDSLRQES